MEGVGVEKFVPSLRDFVWVSREGTWEVPGIVRGCPGPLGLFKTSVQKKFVLIFRVLRRGCVRGHVEGCSECEGQPRDFFNTHELNLCIVQCNMGVGKGGV